MILKQFHSAVYEWFHKTFKTPTEIQDQAWPAIKKNKNTLIAAPTGSGKTLAAFLTVIDELIRMGLEGKLREEPQVVYISPLKALSNDMERNLQIPLKGIKEEMKASGLPEIQIKVVVRTGDTSQSKRVAMVKHPPHILVTTPESMYLLLTSENGRNLLSTVHTLIIDEIHALVGNKRGSHLSLSIARLENLSNRKLKRIGLSATQKPIEEVARFLIGTPYKKKLAEKKLDCALIDIGHKRKMNLSIETPRSPLTAVMSNEVWEEIYDRLEKFIKEHKTTLIFVNTRRLAERMAHKLTEKMGVEFITAHHGSMSKEHRLDAEIRLKTGSLRALVATASLELGIDIGFIDLVCQMGSPKSIGGFLQRVGRSGHTVNKTPKGKLFPLNHNELIECTAILEGVKNGELDHVIMPEKPLDILAQQIVAEVACKEYREIDLYKLILNAYPYRDLSRNEFNEIIYMLSQGFTTRNGRRSAYIYRDIVNERLKARKGARLTALVSGGAIPDNFDFDVILDPNNIFIGTVNEDFAIESMAGDIFQLGNNSWRILRIENGKIRVEDAKNLPPSIPFWLGEAPGRSDVLSLAVSRLRENISNYIGDPILEQEKYQAVSNEDKKNEEWKNKAMFYLTDHIGLDTPAADQVVMYLATIKATLGSIPTQKTIVMERFFDEVGDMHLVIHSSFGSRLNRAWGLALRKRFCRKFNFELQAAANEDSIILSLGVTHSFPLEEVYDYLNPKTVRHVLIQALLDSPMFQVRWRWNASRSLAVLRRRAGKKIPPVIQRMQSEDLISFIFPDQLACLENIAGEREIPDHPLVRQTIHDCLYDAMDIEKLEKLLKDIRERKIDLISLDLNQPSVLSEEILNARPYTFLDNAPLEERRTNAVQSRKWLDPTEGAEPGKLDIQAIQTVKAEIWPYISNPDELHDSLLLCGFLTHAEGKKGDGINNWEEYFEQLIQEKRAAFFETGKNGLKFWVAVERTLQFEEVYPEGSFTPKVKLSEKLVHQLPGKENALVEIIRGRLEMLGPVHSQSIAKSMGLPLSKIEESLLSLENEGFVVQGKFTLPQNGMEWCERRLLARIHRYTLKKLRKEIQPVSSADFMRFLFAWHGLEQNEKPEGMQSLLKVLMQLDGFEAPASSWEGDLLPCRIKDYDPLWLDILCLSGDIVWGRFRKSNRGNRRKINNSIKVIPISLATRTNSGIWQKLNPISDNGHEFLSSAASEVFIFLKEKGASFFDEIMTQTGLLSVQLEEAIAELVASSMVTSDSFTGLRSLLIQSKYRTANSRKRRRLYSRIEKAGRWSIFQNGMLTQNGSSFQNGGLGGSAFDLDSLFTIARVILHRYGVIIRKIAEHENFVPPWRDMVRALRTLEARGEIRGGRFVEGVWGEQFALPEAVAKLRSIKKEAKNGSYISINAADPLNLTGIITPGKRIKAIFNNRILYKDGEPIATKEGKEIKHLDKVDPMQEREITNALIRSNIFTTLGRK